MVVSNEDLKKFLSASSKPSRLLGGIERHLLARPVGDRSTTVLHPSEMIKSDWCKRASYFLLQGTTKVADKPTLRLQTIFDEGHAIHAKWQRWFQEMGVLHGKFQCQACDHVTWGTSPANCEQCDALWTKLVYEEVTLIDNDLRIAGHTDGWIKGIGNDCLIEIKSIGPGTIRYEAPGLMKDAEGDFMKAWKQVRRPFSPHVQQGQVYLELMHRMGNDVDEIVFLYELKADQSYKEFVIKRDFELVRHVFDGAQEVIDALSAKIAPECNVKPGGNCKQCSPYKEG
jgi:uncharacterized protein YihD (DUF1040 family)